MLMPALPVAPDRPTFWELFPHLNEASARQICGVHPATWRRWRASGFPTMARRMPAIHNGSLPWPQWEGFECIRGRIYPPGARDGVTPGEVAALPYLKLLAQECHQLRTSPCQFLIDLH
jgi:hypothetical protein